MILAVYFEILNYIRDLKGFVEYVHSSGTENFRKCPSFLFEIENDPFVAFDVPITVVSFISGSFVHNSLINICSKNGLRRIWLRSFDLKFYLINFIFLPKVSMFNQNFDFLTTIFFTKKKVIYF